MEHSQERDELSIVFCKEESNTTLHGMQSKIPSVLIVENGFAQIMTFTEQPISRDFAKQRNRILAIWV